MRDVTKIKIMCFSIFYIVKITAKGYSAWHVPSEAEVDRKSEGLFLGASKQCALSGTRQRSATLGMSET